MSLKDTTENSAFGSKNSNLPVQPSTKPQRIRTLQLTEKSIVFKCKFLLMLHMNQPLSSWAMGESSGLVSLQDLFDGPSLICEANGLSIDHLAFAICRGGWTKISNRSSPIALYYAYQEIERLLHTETPLTTGSRCNCAHVRQLLRSYARYQGSQASITDLRMDEKRKKYLFSEGSCLTYLKTLRTVGIIHELPAWIPALHTKTVIRTKSTRFFSDPSIGAAALGIGPQDLLVDPKTFGFLFENLCMRDLRIYASALNGDVYHYRDKNNLECDAVLHRHNGSYGLIEIKLGGNEAIEHGAATLQALAKKLDPKKMPAPSFLMVLVGVGPFAYRRKDGVFVVPIGCLKP